MLNPELLKMIKDNADGSEMMIGIFYGFFKPDLDYFSKYVDEGYAKNQGASFLKNYSDAIHDHKISHKPFFYETKPIFGVKTAESAVNFVYGFYLSKVDTDFLCLVVEESHDHAVHVLSIDSLRV